MTHEEIIDNTRQFVETSLAGAEGGHDWWHIYRVWKLAVNIAAAEKADMLVVELAALLHDIADAKFHDGDETKGPRMAGEFLQTLNVDEHVIDHVSKIISNISFKGGQVARTFSSAELSVVQDADRLDAMGAIGIARTFNYGGFRNREIYNPGIPPVPGMDKETYRLSQAPTINHFYEKLLLLKDLMNTGTGKRMAERRHDFMLAYLDEFFREWEGEK